MARPFIFLVEWRRRFDSSVALDRNLHEAAPRTIVQVVTVRARGTFHGVQGLTKQKKSRKFGTTNTSPLEIPMNRSDDSILYALSCLFLLGLIRVLAFPRFERSPEPAYARQDAVERPIT